MAASKLKRYLLQHPRRIIETMRTIWRYYRFVAHLSKSINDFDRMGRLTTNKCKKGHSTEGTVEETYYHVLAARHGKSKRWRGRIARTILAVDIRPNTQKPSHIFSDTLAGAKENDYIDTHKADHTSDVYICITSKGHRLKSLPFGPGLGMLEYSLNSYPRTIAVGFAAALGALGTLLVRWIAGN